MPTSPISHVRTLPPPLSADAALTMLSRHQVRRRQRIPTITVLTGRDVAPSRLVRRWAEQEKRPVREPTSIEQVDAVASWFGALVESRNITAASYAWLARRAGCDVQELSSGLPARSPHERTLLLDRTLGSKNVPPVDAVCRAVIEHTWQNGSTMQGLWQRLLDAAEGDLFRAASGIFALIGDEATPLLHIASRGNDIVPLRTVLAKVASLVLAVPTLPIVVSTDPARLEEYLATTPECRAVALVREGLIRLSENEQSQSATEQGSATAEVPQAPGGGLGPITPSSHASNTATFTPQPTADDPARSAAERYLFERLQAHPETVGLFELNGRLDGTENSRIVEVDLIARGPRVAIEVDGYYHFNDLEAYRRDRRKDVILQHAGYFVIRCLADDVASRLEEILETILAAVCRERAGQGRGG
jgi:hypothetical protein